MLRILSRCFNPTNTPSKFTFRHLDPSMASDLPVWHDSRWHQVLFIYLFIHLFPTGGKEWYLMPHITEQTVCASDSITMSVLSRAWRRLKGVQCILPYSIIRILVPNILRCMLHFYLDITKLLLYPIYGHALLFIISTVCFRKPGLTKTF